MDKFYSVQSPDKLLFYIVHPTDQQHRQEFFSSPEDFIQLGRWRLKQGDSTKPHYHKNVLRNVSLTQEVLIIARGQLRVTIYDFDMAPIGNILLSKGDIGVALLGGHAYEGVDSETEVIEVKNGPYVGAHLDREQF